MFKSAANNNYQKFLKKKHCFDEKVKQGKVFKDSDHDGLSDYEEKNIYGTDPKNPDSDGDGLPDGEEVARGRNPLGPGKLKDLFIPCAGNNYLPCALKPKRLLFHALSLIAMKAIVVIFVIFYPLSAWLSPDLALAEANKIVELTNNLRQAISLPALTENQKLTQAAWQKAKDMALNQYFAHLSPTGLGLRNWLAKVGYEYSIAGENLAVGFSGAEEVVEAWKKSPTHYANIVDGDFKEIGVAVTDGQLNQIDTAFIAQYFAAPRDSGPEIARREPLASTTWPTAEKAPEKEIKIDQQTAVLSIKNDLLNSEKAIQIKTSLPVNTVSAEVTIENKKIILAKESGQTNEWSGVSLISRAEEKNILKPLLPASLAVENSAGAVAYGKIDWDSVKMVKTSLSEHYRLFKDYPAAAMKPIINISDSYFKSILLIAIISLLLNIFIEIKKQHPRVIFYGFAFLALLSAVIIF